MTPIYRLHIGGFDTHAGQSNDHSQRLNQTSNAISAFLQDLKNQGLDDRVMVMTTSEFGRRVGENGSNGTEIMEQAAPSLPLEQPPLAMCTVRNPVYPIWIIITICWWSMISGKFTQH